MISDKSTIKQIKIKKELIKWKILIYELQPTLIISINNQISDWIKKIAAVIILHRKEL